MGAGFFHRGAIGWIACASLAWIAPVGAATAPDPRAEYLRSHAQAPVEYVLSRFTDHRVVLLGENHWLRHDVELVLAAIPRLPAQGVGALAVEMFRAGDQALIDSLVSAARWDPARAMAILRGAQWPYREYLEIIHAVWSVNQSRPAGGGLRLIALGPGLDWRERLLPVGKTYDGFMRDIVEAWLQPGDHRVLIYAGIHHAFTRYHQSELPRASKVERLMDRMGNMLWRDLGEDVFLVTLHRPWQRRIGEKWGRDLPVDGAIDCAAAATGQPVGFDVVGSPFAGLPISRDYWYGLGYPELRLEDITDGYVWNRPIERYEGVRLIPLSEFAPDPASLAEVSANNPFADEKGLGRPEMEALWKKEDERLRDITKSSGWSGLFDWTKRCERSR